MKLSLDKMSGEQVKQIPLGVMGERWDVAMQVVWLVGRGEVGQWADGGGGWGRVELAAGVGDEGAGEADQQIARSAEAGEEGGSRRCIHQSQVVTRRWNIAAATHPSQTATMYKMPAAAREGKEEKQEPAAPAAEQGEEDEL